MIVSCEMTLLVTVEKWTLRLFVAFWLTYSSLWQVVVTYQAMLWFSCYAEQKSTEVQIGYLTCWIFFRIFWFQSTTASATFHAFRPKRRPLSVQFSSRSAFRINRWWRAPDEQWCRRWRQSDATLHERIRGTEVKQEPGNLNLSSRSASGIAEWFLTFFRVGVSFFENSRQGLRCLAPQRPVTLGRSLWPKTGKYSGVLFKWELFIRMRMT